MYHKYCTTVSYSINKFQTQLTSFIVNGQTVKNGSDATAGAVRLARTYTKKDVIACCGYHGWQDWYIGSTSRKLGVPDVVCKLTIPFKYNNLESLKKIFQEQKGKVAGVILEPLNLYLPDKNFLPGIRQLCDENEAILIFDEVITGFRLDMGGAQSLYGVTPDLTTLGKAIANGYPLSVICGKEKYMSSFKEAFFSFTFGGELPSIAAALKTIEVLEREALIGHIHTMGKKLREGFSIILNEFKIDYIQAIGLDFWPAMQIQGTGNYSQWEIMTLFQQEVVRRGILTRPAFFISGAHSEGDINNTLFVIREALDVVNQAVQSRKVNEWTDGKIIQPVIRAS